MTLYLTKVFKKDFTETEEQPVFVVEEDGVPGENHRP
jgi:hypothetical protein